MAASVQAFARVGSRLARASRHVNREIEAELKRAGLPPLGWCEVLFELVRRGGRASPGSLERRLVIEQYNLSRLLDRLAAAGLVRRIPHPTDRRRQYVEIMPAGLDVRDSAARVHAAALERLAAGLSGKQVGKLSDLLAEMLPPRAPRTPVAARQPPAAAE